MNREPKYPWATWFASDEDVHVDCAHYEVDKKIFQIQAIQQSKAMEKLIGTRTCGRHDDCIVLAQRRRPKWDWDRLLNGATHPIWYSDMRPTLPESFIRTAREQAKRRGRSVVVDRKMNEAGLTLTAIPKRMDVSVTVGDAILRRYES